MIEAALEGHVSIRWPAFPQAEHRCVSPFVPLPRWQLIAFIGVFFVAWTFFAFIPFIAFMVFIVLQDWWSGSCAELSLNWIKDVDVDPSSTDLLLSLRSGDERELKGNTRTQSPNPQT